MSEAEGNIASGEAQEVQEEEEPEETNDVSPPKATKKVPPGIEGGSNPEPEPGLGLVGTITSFFRVVEKDFDILRQDLSERADASKISAEGAEAAEQVRVFRELSRDYTNLQSLAISLADVLDDVAAAHKGIQFLFETQSKVFADHSSMTEGLEDGVVSDALQLESPKTGHESDELSEAAAIQSGLSGTCASLGKVIRSFAANITVFNDKILGDLEETVKQYRRNQTLLDAAKAKPNTLPDQLEPLQTAVQKSKDSVNVKLTMMKEKRFNDLSAISHELSVALRTFCLESKSICQ